MVRAVPTTVFYFIPSAITGFIANIFPSRNRVSPNEAFEVLEPDDGKLSCPVLRGLGDRKVARLFGLGPSSGWHTTDSQSVVGFRRFSFLDDNQIQSLTHHRGFLRSILPPASFCFSPGIG